MSVWHEVQIEFARDALDDLIQEYGETPNLACIMEIIKEAEDEATDLPEDNPKENIQRLTRSTELLTKAENKVPNVDEKAFRRLVNKIRFAKEANTETKRTM